MLVARDVRNADAIKIIDRRAQANRIGDVTRASFKALRRRANNLTRCTKCLFKIGKNVFWSLQSNGKADQSIGDAQSSPQFRIEIRVRR
jgi:hypothetical protein